MIEDGRTIQLNYTATIAMSCFDIVKKIKEVAQTEHQSSSSTLGDYTAKVTMWLSGNVRNVSKERLISAYSCISINILL